MRPRSIVGVLLSCLFATGAFAQSISITPSSLPMGSVEEYVTISGTNLTGTVSTVVRYSGAFGTIDIVPDPATPTSLFVFVPDIVTSIPGSVSVTVRANDGANLRIIGPGMLTITGTPPDPTPPPVLNLPEIVVAEAIDVTTPVDFSALVSTNDGSPVICTPASGFSFPLGATNVSCSATNANGTTTGSFTVFVLDTTAPVISVPDDIVSADPVVTYTVTAFDTIDPSPTIFCTHPSGATFPLGTTTVVCVASDDHANFGVDSFTVTITNGTPPPVLTVPDDMIVEATSAAGAVVTFTATATEGGVVSCTPPSGSTFPLGTTTVTCTATNAGGTDTEIFNITVIDSTPPTVTVTADPNVLWPPNHKMVEVTVTVVASDAVDPAPVSQIVSVSSNQPIEGTGDGDAAPDWEITGPLTLNLRAERSGGQARIYTITIVTSDFGGNLTTSTVEVTVPNSRGKR